MHSSADAFRDWQSAPWRIEGSPPRGQVVGKNDTNSSRSKRDQRPIKATGSLKKGRLHVDAGDYEPIKGHVRWKMLQIHAKTGAMKATGLLKKSAIAFVRSEQKFENVPFNSTGIINGPVLLI